VKLKLNNMAQQTAVKWLLQKIEDKNGKEFSSYYQEFIEQAKAMEKEQIINSDLNATIRTAKGFNADVFVLRIKELAEQYYNKTYNK